MRWKGLFFLIVFVLACSVARAEFSLGDTLKGFPELKTGVAFSLQDSNWNYLATVDMVKFAGFNLEAGYAGRAENTADKAVAVLSYDLLKVKDIIDLPILNLIEFRPGVWAGYGRIEKVQNDERGGEFDWGVSVSVIQFKW
jgi:hypothetical protein